MKGIRNRTFPEQLIVFSLSMALILTIITLILNLLGLG